MANHQRRDKLRRSPLFKPRERGMRNYLKHHFHLVGVALGLLVSVELGSVVEQRGGDAGLTRVGGRRGRGARRHTPEENALQLGSARGGLSAAASGGRRPGRGRAVAPAPSTARHSTARTRNTRTHRPRSRTDSRHALSAAARRRLARSAIFPSAFVLSM